MILRFHILLLALLSSGGMAVADDFDSWLSKGNAFDELGKSDRAIVCYREAEKLQPKNAELLCRTAKQYLDSLADTSSRDAKRAFAQSALAYAERAVALDPKNSMAETLVAIAYGRLAKFADARTKVAHSLQIESHARKAIALKPDNDLALYVLGVWNLELANLSSFQRRMVKWIYGGIPAASNAEAEQYLKQAISLNAARPAYFVELGRVYAAMDKTAEARAMLQKALKMPNPGKSDPLMKERAEKALSKLK
jgi:tetratricopeptide (TPR) repeat protein